MPTINKQAPVSSNSLKKPTGPSRISKSKSGLDSLQSAWELEDTIKMLVYGQSGSGKTTMWATFPEPILVAICSGGNKPGELKSIKTPENMKRIRPLVVTSTDEVKTILEAAADYATFVLDHASGLQDLVLKEILGLQELPAQKSWGMASQQDYGTCTLKCKEFFRSMLNLPGNVVLVAQERDFKGESDSDVITPTIGAALTPSLTGWLNPAVDFLVQMTKRPKYKITNRTVGGKSVAVEERVKGVSYCMRTGPHDVYQTKFRVPKGMVLPEFVPDPTYDKLVAIINGTYKEPK